MKNILLVEIQLKRRDMYTKARQFGFTHPQVVACSQELDTLLNRFQSIQGIQKLSS